MRNFFLLVLSFLTVSSVYAQTVKETFDSNSLDWTESPRGYWGSTIIDKGVMTLTAKEHHDYTKAIETHCYAPLNMKRPFKITANVTIGKLDEEDNQRVGLIFNYMDFGNYYVFMINEYNVIFARYKNNELIGQISQGIKWSKKRQAEQTWVIDYNGNDLIFTIDDIPLIKVKYMEMDYSGFGFYAEGKQKFIIEDVEFQQN